MACYVTSLKLCYYKSFFFQCGIEFFQKEGEEYKKMSVAFPPDNCCKVFSNEMLKKAMEKQNIPKGCPIKEVRIITNKPVIWLKQCFHSFCFFFYLFVSPSIKLSLINCKTN